MALTARHKITYVETYKAPGAKIAREYVPSTLPHVTDPRFVVDEMYIMKAGRLDDGREFQDLRVVLRKQ